MKARGSLFSRAFRHGVIATNETDAVERERILDSRVKEAVQASLLSNEGVFESSGASI